MIRQNVSLSPIRLRHISKTVLTILALAIFCNSHYANNGHPFISSYSIEEYRAGPINTSIDQDGIGRLYFANLYGLLRYDGVHWEWFKITEKGISLISLYIDSNDHIYVGSQSEFGVFKPNTKGGLTYTSLSELLPEDERNFEEVVQVTNSKHGIVFHAINKLFVYNNESLKTFNIPRSVNTPGIRYKQELYFLDKTKGLMSFDGQSFYHKLNSESVSGLSLVGVMPIAKNNLLLCTANNGIFIYDEFSTKHWLTTDKLGNREIYAAQRLKDGHIALGTKNNGLFIYDKDKRLNHHLSKPEGLTSKMVYTIYEDHDHNLWLGHNNGISHIETGTPFLMINESYGVEGSGRSAAVMEGNLYLGTNNGLYLKIETGEYNFITGSEGIIHDILKMGEHLLICHSKGIGTIKDNKFKIQVPIEGVWQILPLMHNPNKMIVGKYKGLGLLEIDNNQIISYRNFPSFEESSRVMQWDDNGNLWVTHGLKGAFKIEFDKKYQQIKKSTLYNAQHGLPSNYHLNVFKIKNDLIFSADQGLFQFDYNQNIFVPYRKLDQWLDRSLHLRMMEEDALGNIYFWAQECSGVLNQNSSSDFESKLDLFNKVLYKVDDGIIDYISMDQNELIMGANQGFIRYNATSEYNYEKPFQLIIRQIETYAKGDSTIYKYGAHLEEQARISFDNNAIRFSCSSILFQDNNKTQYKYYIENFDNDWSDWTMDNQKEYINLPEGDYIFKAVAKNVNNVMSNEVSFQFTILPPWYRSKIAYAAYSLLIVALLGFTFLSLNMKHKKEKKSIELQKSIELTEKDTEMRNMSRQSEEQIMSLKNEKLTSEINHKNKELATTTMHLIHKKEFLSQVKTKLLNYSKNNENGKTDKYINSIINEINSDISGDEDWDHFQQHFDKVHGDFAKRLRESYPDLSPQEMKIAAYLRMNLSTKEMMQLLHISVRGVEKGRYRLRKKLQLDSGINLAEFILNF